MRNANNYGEATGDSALSAEVRSLLFRDLDRLKSDMDDIDNRLNAVTAAVNLRTDGIAQDIYDRLGAELRQVVTQYNSLSTQLTQTTTSTSAHGATIIDMRRSIEEMVIAVAVLEGLETRVNARVDEKLSHLSNGVDAMVENRMLRQQNQDNTDLPRATLKDLPTKVGDLDKRMGQLEKRMWLIQIVGTLISALALSFGKEVILAIFKH